MVLVVMPMVYMNVRVHIHAIFMWSFFKVKSYTFEIG